MRRMNFVAVMLPTVMVCGRKLGDPFFWPLYEEAERQGVAAQ